MGRLFQDLRFGARVLSKNPGFSLAAILTLALGIGANTAIFTVTNALLLRPFPYRDPDRLVTIQSRAQTTDRSSTLMRYELVRDRNRSFESVAVWTDDTANVTGHGEPVQSAIVRISPNFFSVLGVRPALGRAFTQEEGSPAGKPVAMIAHSLWRGRFGGDPHVIGQILTLDNTPHVIVGVLPDIQFPFVPAAEIWTPRYFEYSLMTPQRLRQGVSYLEILARLRTGIPLERADAELAVLNRQYSRENASAPDADPAATMTTQPLRNLVIAGIRGKLLMLSASVALVLLIACANVASLLLSRALARKREIAVRTALGATRGALLRQLLTESMLLALAGGVVGAGLAWLGIQALLKWGATQLPQGVDIGMDLRVLLFTIASSLLAGIFFGTFPALQLSGSNLESTLREEGRGSSAGPSHAQLKSLLVAGQVALSLLLLIGAGLMLRSFARLLAINPGFEARNVLTMNVSLPTVKYAQPAQQIAFFDEVERRVSTLPGVRSVAISAALPLQWRRLTPVLPEGQPAVPLAQRPILDIEAISPHWFETLRVPLRAGRPFSAHDTADAPKVVLVNETFARRFWPGRNPVGLHIVVGRGPAPSEVVGVAADVKNGGLAQDTLAQLYLPFPQLPWGNMNLLVRTSTTPESVTSAVRGAIQSIDPDQPIAAIKTAGDLVDGALAQPRFTMLLLGLFSATALALSLIGIYGVLSYWVAQRRYELGIRLALGAQQTEILASVVRQGLLLAISGIVVGLIAAAFLTRLMSSLLFQVTALDPVTFIAAPLIFLAIALLASYLPARTATKLDPLQALRQT